MNQASFLLVTDSTIGGGFQRLIVGTIPIPWIRPLPSLNYRLGRILSFQIARSCRAGLARRSHSVDTLITEI
jgi:hypothetical protein